MKNRNIICFAKEWSEDPTSNNHVMMLLARENKVLWLNSIAMRRPSFTSGRDLSKIGRKLRSFFRGAEHPAPNLWVVTPIVLPFPHSKLATAVNRWILLAMIGHYRRKLDMAEFQLWTFLPNAVEYVGTLGESLVVYYCIDEWSHFTYLDGARMIVMEKELMQRADVNFMTANSLLESKKHLNPHTYLASHGVDHAHFAKAMAPDTAVPGELAGLPHPIVGFFGLVHEWIDLKLIEKIARTHPGWSVVIIGKTIVDTSALTKLPNVHLLGRRPYEGLPGYCKAFDAGIIPFAVNELTYNVNPIKLREYLSAGLPVVSTDLPEVKYYSDIAYVAHTHEEFIANLEQALREDSPEKRRQRSDSMRSETWEARVAAIGETVAAAQGRHKTK